jgi:hypothetical protein
MNDFSELEDQLRKLRPVQPSAELITRIERALAEETITTTAAVLPRERRFNFNWLSLGLGLTAVAALLLFAFLQFERPRKKTSALASISPVPDFSTNSNAQLVPAGLTQVVYHTRDEGLHYAGNSAEPMRRVRSQTRDTLQWRDPNTGATLRISYPSEQVSLVPVTGQ